MQHRVTHPALLLGIVCGLVGIISGCGDHKRSSAPVEGKADAKAEKPIVPAKPAPSPEEPTGDMPHAVYDQDRYDAGVVERGEVVTRQFVVRNEGTADMDFVAGKPNDPNSTKISVDRPIIPPGEEGIVTMSVDTSGIGMEAGAGGLSARAPVGVSAPDESTIRFFIDLKLANKLKLAPDERWRPGDMSGAKPMIVTGHIYSSAVEKFSVNGIQSSSEHLQATFREMEPDELGALGEGVRCGYEITASISPQVRAGYFAEYLTVETDYQKVDSTEPVLQRIWIFSKRIGPVRVFGPKFDNENMLLSLDRVNAKTGKKAILTMMLRDAGTREVKILDISSTDDAVKLNIELIPESDPTPNRRYKLTFEIPPNAVLASESFSQAFITVKTDLPGAESIGFHVTYAPN